MITKSKGKRTKERKKKKKERKKESFLIKVYTCSRDLCG